LARDSGNGWLCLCLLSLVLLLLPLLLHPPVAGTALLRR
jgi:hypothetical protein